MTVSPRDTQPAAHVHAVEGALRRFGAFRRRWATLEGLGRTVAVGLGALVAWFAADWLLRLPPWPLLLSFAVAPAVALWAVARRLLRPMLRRVDAEREALVAERLHGALDNQLIGALQLGREASRAGRPLGYSRGLVAALLGRVAGLLATLDLRTLVDLRRARRALLAACVPLAVAAASLAFAGDAVSARIARLRDAYAAVLDSLFPVEMRVSPGDVAVVRGRPVTLGVEVLGARRRTVRLVRGEPATADELALEEGKASFHIASVQDTFAYHFEYGGRASAEHRVLVDDLPTVSAINYELAYPAYTGFPPRTLTGRVPRLQALVGTRVLVSFAATTALHADLCHVAWGDGTRQGLSISGRFGHFSFVVERPDRAAVHLTGALGPGFEMERPVAFEVAVQRDQPPRVQVRLKRKKLTLLAAQAAAFGLRWVAEDDFGVAEVEAAYRIDAVDELLRRPIREGSVPRRIDPPRDRVRGVFAELFKSLSPPLQPGDRITLTVSAKDNNTETGPRRGRSQAVEIVVVRPDLSAFAERAFGFEAHALLGGLHKVKRATNLLVDPVRTVRTETKQDVERHRVKSRVAHEAWPSGAEDAIGDYFRLLSESH